MANKAIFYFEIISREIIWTEIAIWQNEFSDVPRGTFQIIKLIPYIILFYFPGNKIITKMIYLRIQIKLSTAMFHVEHCYNLVKTV